MNVNFSECSIFNYRFGFLGEVYIEPNVISMLETDIVEKYFSYKEPYYCSRNQYYYSTDLEVIRGYLMEYEHDISVVINLPINDEDQRCILFCLINYVLNDVSKLLGIVFSYKTLRYKYYRRVKGLLQDIVDELVCLLFGEAATDVDVSVPQWVEEMIFDINRLGSLKAREYSEMDNFLILIKSFIVYQEYIDSINLIVSPLQGGSLIPPVYRALSAILSGINPRESSVSTEYVRYSVYDNSHYIDISIEEQIDEIKNYNGIVQILLVDDNVGTGETLKVLREYITKEYDSLITAAIEFRWDGVWNMPNYPVFDPNDIDLISPLEYRHYGYFHEEISYIKLCNTLSPKYHENFYELEYAYHEFDLENYLQDSIDDEVHRLRTLDIYRKHRKLESLA